MIRRRAWVAAAAALPLAVAGITAATVAPAAAAPGNTTVTCVVTPETPQEPALLDCTIADPDGIRAIAYRYPDFAFKDRIVDSGPFACGGTEDNTQYDLQTSGPTRITITVVDCDHPRNRAVFVVHPNGTVKEIRNY